MYCILYIYLYVDINLLFSFSQSHILLNVSLYAIAGSCTKLHNIHNNNNHYNNKYKNKK